MNLASPCYERILLDLQILHVAWTPSCFNKAPSLHDTLLGSWYYLILKYALLRWPHTLDVLPFELHLLICFPDFATTSQDTLLETLEMYYSIWLPLTATSLERLKNVSSRFSTLPFEVLQSFFSWVGILCKCINNILYHSKGKKNSMQFFVKTQRLLVSDLSSTTSNGLFSGKVCVSVWVWVCLTKSGMTNPIKTNIPKSIFCYPFQQPTCNQ